MKILLVDDSQVVLSLERIMLVGHHITIATTGAGALEAIEQDVPDVVVMDVEMPRMDGIECCRHIRVRWPRVVVVMVSGNRSVDSQADALKAGARAFLVKPFDKARLLRAIGA